MGFGRSFVARKKDKIYYFTYDQPTKEDNIHAEQCNRPGKII